MKTVCRLFCRGFGKMARVYELLLLRRSLGRYRGKVRLFGDDARSDQLIAIVPGCELSRRDSTLRFVEKQVGRVRTDEEFRSLQRLAVADTDIETTLSPVFNSRSGSIQCSSPGAIRKARR